MPLPEPAPREAIHTRTITCDGFRREDGLWDIEGRLTDVKTYAFPNAYRGEVRPGEPIHDMSIRLTVDDSLEIKEVAACTDLSPYAVCPDIVPNYQRLVGERIKPGFTKRVQDLLGGARGCTHLRDLLGPIATTAYQTIFPFLMREKPTAGWGGDKTPRRPPLLDSCYAFRSDGDIARRNWPEWFEREAAPEGSRDE